MFAPGESKLTSKENTNKNKVKTKERLREIKVKRASSHGEAHGAKSKVYPVVLPNKETVRRGCFLFAPGELNLPSKRKKRKRSVERNNMKIKGKLI